MSRKFLMSFIGVASLALLAVGGCSTSDDTSTSVTNPNPNPFHPVGTIQGVVRDRVTLEPIVNAIVTIDVASAVTDSTGSYHIDNVPATADSINGYTIQVDLRAARNEKDAGETVHDVDMKDATKTPRYPDIVYANVAVTYTSLNDTECEDTEDSDSPAAAGDGGDGGAGGDAGSVSCANSSNHDTPVDHLVATPSPIEVGKLACGIQGTVYGCATVVAGATSFDYATPVGSATETYDVILESGTDTVNTGTGSSGNVVMRTTTTVDPNDPTSFGYFSFDNIECGNVDFNIVAMDDEDNPTMHGVQDIDSPDGDFQTVYLHLDENAAETNPDKDEALHVCSNDDLGPSIVAISPEPRSDLAPTDPDNALDFQDVVITFHEPVRQTAYTSTNPSGVSNLGDDFYVNFDGAKAGNTAFSLIWNVDFTQLTASFKTGSSSRYTVMLPNLFNLTDASGNGGRVGICPSVTAPGWTAPPGIGGGDDCVISFSTFGGQDPISPVVTVTNANDLDEAAFLIPVPNNPQPSSTTTAQLDWANVSGAKQYRLYCRAIEVWGTVRQPGPWIQDDITVGTDGMVASGSSATVDLEVFSDVYGTNTGANRAFVENEAVKLEYECLAVSLNSDGTESAFDETKADVMADVKGPLFAPEGAIECTNAATTTCTGVVGGEGTITALELTFNEEMDEDSVETATFTVNVITGGNAPTIETVVYEAPGAGENTVTITFDSTDSLLSTDLPRDTITPGADGVLNTTPVADDTVDTGGTIDTGPNGVNETVADPLDARLILFGQGLANQTAITVGANLVLNSVVAGDDQMRGGSVVTGANGRRESGLASSTGDDVQVIPVGQGLANGACVTDGLLDTVQGGDDVDSDDVGGGTIDSGPNGICETTAGVGDTQVTAVGSGAATVPVTTCITAGVNVILETVTLVGGDAVVGTTISAGPNGICDTAAADDVASLAFGDGVAGSLCITEVASNETAGAGLNDAPCTGFAPFTCTNLLGDDVDSSPGGFPGTVTSGPNGVCETTADGGNTPNPAIALGSGTANSTSISTAGANGILSAILAGDDAITLATINNGPDGINNSAIVADDLADPAMTFLPFFGSGLPNQVEITSGPNGFLESAFALGGDDRTMGTISAGPDGILDSCGDVPPHALCPGTGASDDVLVLAGPTVSVTTSTDVAGNAQCQALGAPAASNCEVGGDEYNTNGIVE